MDKHTGNEQKKKEVWLMGPRVRKLLITGMIWSFVLSIYEFWFQSMWDQFLVSNGHTIGLAETAGGFFLAWMAATVLGWWISRTVEGKPR